MWKYVIGLIGLLGGVASIVTILPFFGISSEGQKQQTRQETPISQAPQAPAAASQARLSVGADSIVVGGIPSDTKVGDRSVVIGSTDSRGNTILNQGSVAIGQGATAGPDSIAIGANANAGRGHVDRSAPQ